MDLGNGSEGVEAIYLDPDLRCDGILTCTNNSADETFCPKRFVCPSGQKVSIPIRSVCDGFVDCGNNWDENSTACPHRFRCLAWNGKKVSIWNEMLCM